MSTPKLPMPFVMIIITTTTWIRASNKNH
jgi:hypothetical protein